MASARGSLSVTFVTFFQAEVEVETSDLGAFVQLWPEQVENSDSHAGRTLLGHMLDSGMI